MAARSNPSGGPKSSVSEGVIKKVHSQLREGWEQGVTRSRLLTKLGISPRTLERALAVIEAEGGRIGRCSAGIPGRTTIRLILLKDPSWAAGISHHARLALQVAELTLEQGGSELWSLYLPVFERLLAPHLTPKDRRLFEQLKNQLSVRGAVEKPIKRDPNLFQKLLEVLSAAPALPQLEILYSHAGDVEPAWAVVVPYSLTHDALAGSAYLLAWDQEQACPRHFRLSRIESARIHRRVALLSESQRSTLERARTFQIGGWFADTPPFEVVVEVSGSSWVKAFLDAHPALPRVEVTDVSEPGSPRIRVRFEATELEGPARWVLQLGPNAKVVGPDFLRDQMMKKLRACLDQYAT